MTKITFQCYACNQTLKVAADKAGKKAKCIKCQTILTIPVASDPSVGAGGPPPPPQRMVVEGSPPPVPPRPRTSVPPPANDLDFTADAPPPPPVDDDYDEAPRSRRGRDDDYDDDDYDDDYDNRPKKKRRRGGDDYDDAAGVADGKEFGTWAKMRLGFFVALIGMLVVGGAFALENLAVLILTFMSFASRPSQGLITTIAVICRIAIAFGFGGFIATLVGYVFWIFGKNRNNSMVWAIVTVSVAGVALIFLLIFRFIPIFPPSSTRFGPFGGGSGFSSLYLFMTQNYGLFAVFRPAGDVILTILAQLFLHATWMMSAFYLMMLGKTLKDKQLSRRALMLVILTGCSAGYQLIWPLLVRAFASGPMFGLSKGVAAVIWLFYWIGVGLMVTIIIMLILNYRRAKEELE